MVIYAFMVFEICIVYQPGRFFYLPIVMCSFPRASKQMVAVDVFRHRELKWVEMLQNWDKWMSKKFPKVRFKNWTPLYSLFLENDLGTIREKNV